MIHFSLDPRLGSLDNYKIITVLIFKFQQAFLLYQNVIKLLILTSKILVVYYSK